MPMVRMVEYDNAGPEVKAVYDDIMATRNRRRRGQSAKTTPEVRRHKLAHGAR